MCSELECGVCYLTFNAGRRCPRELHCKHSFCESCLLALARPGGAGEGRSIVCPLCRRTTSISGERRMRAELRVDEGVLQRLLAAGVLEREDGEEVDREAEEEDARTRCRCEEEEHAAPGEASDEEGVAPAAISGGALRRSLRKVWKKISGNGARPRGENCMTDADLRSMAMMACYMF
ncbi:E3 ubiquitin-protein ligase-like [Betta splendens]|uniref:E3 ubiquitin-protein ligase-like n=1 Tax=Betta splendens TaxID=158456 RepID=A0A6P7LXG5_BETSP|nr:E3 ubiquitin-protein ligase-like [Betta splendens]